MATQECGGEGNCGMPGGRLQASPKNLMTYDRYERYFEPRIFSFE